ncbi:unnamed protein product [Rotaria sp. Silwood2]|nr:unnamed protein product [Rotaria sp. Silwood2]
MAERLTVEFCKITRRELANIMLKRKNEIDVKLLRFAIEKTVGFEIIVEKRFQGNTLDHANNPITSHLNVKVTNTNGNDDLNLTTNLKPKSSPFQGIISQCFEDHLDIYIAELDRCLDDQIQKFVDELKKDGYPKFEGSEDTSNVVPTSADLFVYFRNCLVQCSKLSTGQSLLLLVQTFQKYLREYANRILTANLPKTNTTASSLVGTTRIFIQNLPNIPSMLKEGETIAKLNESEIYKRKEKITKSLVDKISFESERNIFKAIIAESIQILIQDLENACESALTAMTKLSWQTIETVGDQSLYVTTIINHLKTIAPAIRNHLGLSRKYFIQFCTTFVDSFIKKFINHLYRCKPINIIGAEQVLLDTHSLKTVLLDLPSINLTVSRKPPQNFTKIILKNMTRAEMILKVVLTPNDFARQFVKSYLQLMNNDGDISSFQKILDMKGIRRPEQAHLIERLKREHATIIASHQQQIQQHIIIFRLISWFIIRTYFIADEYWQTFEIAHLLAFGYGYKTWEWKSNIPIRSYLYPFIILLIYRFLTLFHLDTVSILVNSVTLFQTLLVIIGDLVYLKFLQGHKLIFLILLCRFTCWYTMYSSPRLIINNLEEILFICSLAAAKN